MKEELGLSGRVSKVGSNDSSTAALVWQPIETAPIAPFNPEKYFVSSSPYLLLWCGRVVVGWYSYTKKGEGRWESRGGIERGVTHWMPLPEPPK